MKKLNFRMVLMATLVIGSTAFISCSSDDEDGSNGGVATSKRIKKITDEYDGRTTTITFDYDSQGRVIKKVETEKEPGYNWEYKTTYTYGENTISRKDSDGETCIYTLSNGRIVKEVRKRYDFSCTCNYTYDSNGYLKSITYNDSDNSSLGKIDFTWNGGNLTKYSETEDDYLYNQTISYSNIPWPKYYMLEMECIDGTLEPLGVWGNMPKNLPSKVVQSSNDFNSEYTYDYTIEDGVITKIVITGNGTEYDRPIVGTEIVTFEWE